MTKKGIDARLTAIEIETAEDLRDLFDEVAAEVRNADSSSLELEPRLRIELRAVEIALRVIEISRFRVFRAIASGELTCEAKNRC